MTPITKPNNADEDTKLPTLVADYQDRNQLATI